MLRNIGRYLLRLIPMLLGISLLSFVLMHSVSGDVVDTLYENAGGYVSEEIQADIRHELGLDRPILIQYTSWLLGVVRGDMGQSYVTGRDVFAVFMSKLPSTLFLAFCSVGLTAVISVLLGVIAAVRQNHVIDYLIRLLSFIGNSLPSFFIALLLILFFSVRLGWFSVIGGSGGGFLLPVLTLSIAMSSKYIRQVRTVVLEELNQDYVFAARARGVRERVILQNSVMKTAFITIITLLSLSFGSLLGGTAVVESVFLWDGVGKLAVDSIIMRDYPMIQAYVLWMALIYSVINIAADVIHRMLDPRVRRGQDQIG